MHEGFPQSLFNVACDDVVCDGTTARTGELMSRCATMASAMMRAALRFMHVIYCIAAFRKARNSLFSSTFPAAMKFIALVAFFLLFSQVPGSPVLPLRQFMLRMRTSMLA